MYMKEGDGYAYVNSNYKLVYLDGRFRRTSAFEIPLTDIKGVNVQLTQEIRGWSLATGFLRAGAKKKKYLTVHFSTQGLDSTVIFDFPGDIGDSNKTALASAITENRQRVVSVPASPEQPKVTAQTVVAICPSCKARVPAESKFCSNCGADLQTIDVGGPVKDSKIPDTN